MADFRYVARFAGGAVNVSFENVAIGFGILC